MAFGAGCLLVIYLILVLLFFFGKKTLLVPGYRALSQSEREQFDLAAARARLGRMLVVQGVFALVAFGGAFFSRSLFQIGTICFLAALLLTFFKRGGGHNKPQSGTL